MDKKKAYVSLVALVAVVAESKLGAPSGILYAGMMAHGLTLDDYNVILGVAKEAGLVTERGFLVTITQKGTEFAARVEAAMKG